jgi:hypothetical protein
MQSLFDAIARFFQQLFGKKENPASPRPAIPPSQGAFVVLTRLSQTPHDIMGQLKVNGKPLGLSLEASSNALPEGTYDLSLRTTGGLHATYGYKFGALHRGMVRIMASDPEAFHFLKIGNLPEDTIGGIIVGMEVPNESETGEAREIWHSEEAYRQIYPLLAEKLEAGEPIQLLIRSA